MKPVADEATPLVSAVTFVVVHERPPFWDRLVAAGLKPDDTTVFAYGATVYAPAPGPLTPDVLVHEATHAEQQDEVGGPDRWWDTYISLSAFRLTQELEAYQV